MRRTIALAFLFAAAVARAQDPSLWRFYGVADGFDENYIRSVSLSSDGFAWVGHGQIKSMNVFDGYRNRSLPVPDECVAVPGCPVFGDSAGNAWAFNPGGLFIYRDSQWVRRQLQDSGPIISALSGTDGDPLVLLKDRVVSYDLGSGTLSTLWRATRFGELTGFAGDLAQGLWITSKSGIGVLRQNKLTHSLDWNQLAAPQGITQLHNLFVTRSQEVLVTGFAAARNEWLVSQFSAGRWRTIHRGQTPKFRAWKDFGDRTWLWDGIDLIKLGDSGFLKIDRADILSGNIRDVTVQPDGVFWISTSQGLARYAPYLWRAPDLQLRGNPFISAIAEEPSGSMWFGTPRNLVRLRNSQWDSFSLPAGWELNSNSEAICALADGSLVLKLIKDELNAAWRFEPRTGAFRQIELGTGRTLRSLAAGGQGTALIATIAPAVPGMEIDTYNGERLQLVARLGAEWTGGETRSIVRGADGSLWIGGLAGLGRYTNGNLHMMKAAEGFSDPGVFYLREIRPGILWAGGSSHVFEWNGSGWKVLHKADRVRRIATAGDGTIWLASTDGVLRYAHGIWSEFSGADGLPSSIAYSVYADSGGRVWAGTTRGISLFHPEADRDPPRTFIREEENLRESPPGGEVHLQFLGIDKWKYTAAERLLFSYQMDGGAWSLFGPGTTASYRRLPAGKHTFHVRAMDRNGNIDSSGAQFEFTVMTAWYENPRFQAAAALVWALIFYLSFLVARNYRYRGRLILEKEDSIRAQAQALRDLEQRTSELHESENLYRTIVNSVSDYAIFQLDVQGLITSWNPGAERIKLYAAEQVIGKHFSMFYPEEKIQLGYPELELQTAAREGCFKDEGIRIRADGSHFWASVMINAIIDDAGKLCGYSKITADATERKMAHEQLEIARTRAEEANQAKDRFLATMSHEIRTPMNSILGITEILSETALTPDQRNYVDICRRAASALMSLINDMLDVSKIEAGHLELEHIEFDLEEVLEQSLELTAPKARAKGLTVSLHNSEGLPACLLGDPNRLRQVLLNLLGNAVKFTHSGEIVLHVTTAGEPESGEIAFAVSDTGIGIPADKVEAIFEDFNQADPSTTRNYGGTGLGLGISRRLVEKMGGRLTVTSEPGKGSTFTFTIAFPVLDRPSIQWSPDDELRGRSALVVDDNATTRVILMELLSSWGVNCTDFGRSLDALAALQQRASTGAAYDVILIDCQMDEMNGFDLAKCIRSVVPGTPVLMLTSDAHTCPIEKRGDAGLACYAIKPVRRSHLFALVCDAIRKASRTDERHHVDGSTEGAAMPAIGRPLRILVAEDMPDNQLLVRAYMKETPHELTFAADGLEAVSLVRDGAFDLVMMDVLMPLMDGLAATRRIRAYERNNSLARTAVIAYSANATAEDVRRSLEAGCQAHLAKPVSKRALLAAIDEYAERPSEAPWRLSGDLGHANPLEEIADLIPNYLETCEKDRAAIPEFLSDGKFEAIVTIGHNLKGSGGSYGFPELSRLGEALEKAAKKHNTQELLRIAEDLRALLDAARTVAQ